MDVKGKTSETSEQALENKCPSCNASISFDPKLGKWKCDYCGSEFTLEELNKYEHNASIDKKDSSNNKDLVDDYNEYVSYKCKSCGAEIVADSETAATFCVYCGNTAILKSKLSGKFSPDKIIPFSTEKNQAIEAFKALLKGRPLMPRDFNDVKNIEKIKGVYIPFWLYDIGTNGDVIMEATNVKNWSSGDTHYTKTDYYDVIRGGSMSFSGIPVDGSTRFDNDIMNSIEPFDYSKMIPYNHAYLSGFYAEKYDVSGDDASGEANKRAISSSRSKLYNSVLGYSSVTIKRDTLSAVENKREYAMLPVWMVNVKYNNKLYIFAMNGETGKFIGNIPLDKKRVFFFTVLTFIISFLVCFLVSYIIYLSKLDLSTVMFFLIFLFVIIVFIFILKNIKKGKKD